MPLSASRRLSLRRSLQRLVLRSAHTPLRHVWWLLYRALEQLLATLLRRHHPERAVYVAGGFASDQPLYGVSDLDLVVVTPASPPPSPGIRSEAARADWSRIRRRLRIPNGPVHAVVHEQAGLEAAASGTTYTYGLDRAPGAEPALYHGPDNVWRTGGAGLLHGPGPAGPGAGWRLLAGPDRRPASVQRPEHAAPIVWLTLQSWWRWAFDACLRPERPHVPYLCVKLISEPIRLLLWLRGGALLEGRVAPLRAAAAELPSFAPAAARALELHARLPRLPDPSLSETLTELVALSAELALEVDRMAFADGEMEVRLLSGHAPILPHGTPATLPLGDWRSLCFWFPPDEALLPLDLDPTCPAALASAAHADDGVRAPALRRGPLLIEPTAEIHERGALRTIHCPASDPVSFAVLSGRKRARFPRLAGWSISAWARRAVAEHRAWLADDGPRGPAGCDRTTALGKLFGAARAAHLLETLRDGEPELALTAGATVTALAGRDEGVAAEAAAAIEPYRRAREEGRPVPARAVAALRRELLRLESYFPGDSGEVDPAPLAIPSP